MLLFVKHTLIKSDGADRSGMMLAANFVQVDDTAAFRDMAGILREYTQE